MSTVAKIVRPSLNIPFNLRCCGKISSFVRLVAILRPVSRFSTTKLVPGKDIWQIEALKILHGWLDCWKVKVASKFSRNLTGNINSIVYVYQCPTGT